MDEALNEFYETWRIFVTSDVEPKLLQPSVKMYFENTNRKQKTLSPGEISDIEQFAKEIVQTTIEEYRKDNEDVFAEILDSYLYEIEGVLQYINFDTDPPSIDRK